MKEGQTNIAIAMTHFIICIHATVNGH